MARLQALHRRSSGEKLSFYKVGDLALNLLSREVWRGQRKIDLTKREFGLLEYLMRTPGQVLTRTQIQEHVWDYHFDPQTNLVDVYIQRVRRKVDEGEPTRLIHTVRGAGLLRQSRRMKPWPLRWQLALLTACLVALVSAAAGGAASWHLYREGIVDMDEDIEAVTSGIFATLRATPHFDWASRSALHGLLPVSRHLYLIEVLGRKGELLYRSRELNDTPIPDPEGAGRYRIYAAEGPPDAHRPI